MRYPILMADVMDSRLADPNVLITRFRQMTDHVNATFSAEMLSPLTITLGDEFQGIVKSMKAATQIIFALEEYALENGFDFRLRYVLHFGTIDTPVNPEKAYAMLGQGLTDARKSLQELKKEDVRFRYSTGKPERDSLLHNAFRVYQDLADDWKPKDRTTVSAFLKYQDYKMVARITGTDPSSAWRREKSLKIRAYNAIKNIIFHLIPSTT